MIRGLRARLAIAFIGIAAGIVFLTTLILILDVSYHFSMFRSEDPSVNPLIPALNIHYELVMKQSFTFIGVGAILLAIIVSLFLSKKITAPLVEMRSAAEQMTLGNLDCRIDVRGRDELADLGRSLNHLAEQLQQQEALRKTLTADVAHELRTPLTTLKSHMEAFEDGIWEPTPKRIHSCYEEIERLINLVSDLEQLSYVESPMFTLDFQMEDLASVAMQSVEAVRAAYLQKGIALHQDEVAPIWIWIDRQRVIQIIVNLLFNALKFTPSGGTVTVRISDENESAILSVIDTGIGIKKTEIPFLFERFYRVDKSRNRKFGGGGIGLTIVKRLVEAHGGSVWIESEKETGTKVQVRLPKHPKVK